MIGRRENGGLSLVAVVPVPVDEEWAGAAPGEGLHVGAAQLLIADVKLNT